MWLKAPVGGILKDLAWPLPGHPYGRCHRDKGWTEVGGEGKNISMHINTVLANLSSISENSSLPAESKMKSSWDQKSSCQKRTQEESSQGFPLGLLHTRLACRPRARARAHGYLHTCATLLRGPREMARTVQSARGAEV